MVIKVTIKAGNVTIDGENGTIKTGDKVTIDGKDGKIAAGKVAVDGKDGYVTGLENKDWDPENTHKRSRCYRRPVAEISQDLG